MSCKCFCNRCGKPVDKKYWDGMIYRHTNDISIPGGCYTFHLCNNCKNIVIRKGWDKLWEYAGGSL